MKKYECEYNKKMLFMVPLDKNKSWGCSYITVDSHIH